MLGLLSGLLLLGLVLALKRQDERGSLWGCIGLHGGLVGGWFLANQNLLMIDPSAPMWLVGPGGAHANPLGGMVAILSLTTIGAKLFLRTRKSQSAPFTTPHNVHR